MSDVVRVLAVCGSLQAESSNLTLLRRAAALAALQGTLRAVSARIGGGVPIVRGPGEEEELRALVAGIVEAVRGPDAP
jgi:NAD(P)H-dependent FMN reductase